MCPIWQVGPCWMASHRLKLNQQKTEFLWIGSWNTLSKLPNGGPQLVLESCTVPVSGEARCLGVIIEPDLSMKRHVQTVSRACFYQLRQLKSIRHSVDSETASTLVHAFVTSRLDYCNSLLAGCPKVVTDVLQKVQNAAARLLTGSSRRQHGIQQIMHQKLHWLNITDRIRFKLCLIVYKSLHGLSPRYLSELVTPVAGSEYRHRLRSATHGDLVIPEARLTTYGHRSFSYAGAKAWNALPNHLKDHSLTLDAFKRGLKTHFLSSYL